MNSDIRKGQRGQRSARFRPDHLLFLEDAPVTCSEARTVDEIEADAGTCLRDGDFVASGSRWATSAVLSESIAQVNRNVLSQFKAIEIVMENLMESTTKQYVQGACAVVTEVQSTLIQYMDRVHAQTEQQIAANTSTLNTVEKRVDSICNEIKVLRLDLTAPWTETELAIRARCVHCKKGFSCSKKAVLARYLMSSLLLFLQHPRIVSQQSPANSTKPVGVRWERDADSHTCQSVGLSLRALSPMVRRPLLRPPPPSSRAWSPSPSRTASPMPLLVGVSRLPASKMLWA